MAVSQAFEDQSRWEPIESAMGSVEDRLHDWDEDSRCLDARTTHGR